MSKEDNTIITSLPEGHYFVFGSNEAGRHGKGAALCAKKYFGAIYGQGHGEQGRGSLTTAGSIVTGKQIGRAHV